MRVLTKCSQGSFEPLVNTWRVNTSPAEGFPPITL
jgi:hypothetical protein